jgi:adenylylsulfate kinase
LNRIKKRKLGYVLWITGLPGSGKTSIAKKINNHYKKKNFDFLEISGDEIRKVLKFDNYDKKSRNQYAKSYARVCKILSEKGVNVIFSTVSLFHEIHKWNKKNIKNYKEVYIK